MRFVLWLSLTLALGYAAFGPRFTTSNTALHTSTTVSATAYDTTNGPDPIPPMTK